MGMLPEAPQPAMEQSFEAEDISEPERIAPSDGAWAGARVVLDASEGARQAMANGAVLYVMIRTPGPAMGPPLGVRRLTDPSFPLELTLTDADSMLAERLISSVADIEVQARVSLSGMPAAQAGDWQSAGKAVETTGTSLVVLDIDQQVE